jgi:hypothetical protein
VFGVEADRLAVVGDRAVIVSFGLVGAASVSVSEDLFGIEPDRLAIVGYSAIEVALGLVGPGPVRVRADKFRV